jgi:hypothetical protein
MLQHAKHPGVDTRDFVSYGSGDPARHLYGSFADMIGSAHGSAHAVQDQVLGRLFKLLAKEVG